MTQAKLILRTRSGPAGKDAQAFFRVAIRISTMVSVRFERAYVVMIGSVPDRHSVVNHLRGRIALQTSQSGNAVAN